MKDSLQVIDLDYLRKKAREQGRKTTVLRARNKLEVLERDGFKCVNCKREDRLTIDHFKRPTKIAHKNAVWYDPACCKTLCLECHAEKNKMMRGVPYG